MKKSVKFVSEIIAAIVIGTSVSNGNPWFGGWSEIPLMKPEMVLSVSNVTAQSLAVEEIKTKLLKYKKAYIMLEWIEKYYPEELASIDNAFGGIGVWCANSSLPQCMTNLIDATATVQDYGVLNSFMKRHGNASVFAYREWIPSDMTISEALIFISAFFEHEAWFTVDNLHKYQNHLKSVYSKEVKRKLRNEGKSFVVSEDGVNPMSAYMDNFVAVLNAPKFAGINECMAAIGYNDFHFNPATLPSDSYVNELKEKILFGEVYFTPERSALLLVCLGVDGYNQFVREYNGQK